MAMRDEYSPSNCDAVVVAATDAADLESRWCWQPATMFAQHGPPKLVLLWRGPGRCRQATNVLLIKMSIQRYDSMAAALHWSGDDDDDDDVADGRVRLGMLRHLRKESLNVDSI
ncbi:hypothetical protein BLOT_013096 [Blomia tropicalis]|nr:hypothetical protein BLOT_013096 [Blomia tropicalis]